MKVKMHTLTHINSLILYQKKLKVEQIPITSLRIYGYILIDCKLTCRALDDNLVYTRAEASEDGTMCRAAGAAFESRCVKGRCEVLAEEKHE